MKQFLGILLFTTFSFTASANYNANMQGVLQDVMIYTDNDHIYFRLENQPTTHPVCQSSYFVIENSIPMDRRQMLLSRLMTAYVTKERVNIGYDASVECAHGHIKVHRVG